MQSKMRTAESYSCQTLSSTTETQPQALIKARNDLGAMGHITEGDEEKSTDV